MQQARRIEEEHPCVTICWIKEIKRSKLAVHEVRELRLVTMATTWPSVQPPQMPLQAVVGRLVSLLAVSSKLAILATIEDPVAESIRTVVGGRGVTAYAKAEELQVGRKLHLS